MSAGKKTKTIQSKPLLSSGSREHGLYLSLFLGSCFLSVYEISLLRFSAATFNIYFNLFVLIITLLGLGLGGGIASMFSGSSAREAGGRWISTALSAMGLAMSLSLIPSLLIPLGSLISLVLVLIALSGPFICWGTNLGVLFREHGEDAGYLFGTCMGGAALGLFLGLGLLRLLNGPVLVIMVSAAVIGVTGFSVYRIKRNAVLAAAAVLALVTLGIAVRWDPAPVAQWSSGVTFRGTTLSQVAKQPGTVASLDTVWDARHRTDLVGLKSGHGDFRWVFTDGVMSSSMPGNPGTKDMEWLRKGFPLVALPFLAGKPDRVLVISPGGGLVLRVASDAGASVVRGIEPDGAIQSVLDRSQSYHGYLLDRSGVEVIFEDVRRNLRRDTSSYDAVYLLIREPAGLSWIGSGLGESMLTTQEAFEEYWKHLKPGGMLIMNFTHESLFIRALFSIGDIIAGAPGGDTRALRERSWGFQLAPSAVQGGNGNNYLLMAVKGVPDSELTKNVLNSGRGMPIIGLFGPGITTANNFAWLDSGLDLNDARTGLAREIETRYGMPLDLDAAKDRKPFFFIVVQRIDPYTRWGLGLGLLLLIFFFLFPLSSSRPLDAPEACDRPPLPVYLFSFALLGAGIMLTESAVMQLSTVMVGDQHPLFLLPLGAFLSGMGIGAVMMQKDLFTNKMFLFISTFVAAVALLVLGLWGVGMSFLPFNGSGGVLSAGYGLLLGLCLGTAFPLGINALYRILPKLIPWAWASYSIALVIGMVLVQWIAPHLGLNGVWLGALACITAVLLLGIALWRPSAFIPSCRSTLKADEASGR